MTSTIGETRLNDGAAHNFRNKSAAELWPPLAHFVVAEARLGQWASQRPAQTTICYRIHHNWRHMPLLLAAFLAASFIWIAENLATFSRIWLYPNQLSEWRPVGIGKLGAWFLLQIISYALVALARRPAAPDDAPLLMSQARHRDRLSFRTDKQSSQSNDAGS